MTGAASTHELVADVFLVLFFFLFCGYRIVVHSFQAQEPSGRQTNLRYAETTE